MSNMSSWSGTEKVWGGGGSSHIKNLMCSFIALCLYLQKLGKSKWTSPAGSLRYSSQWHTGKAASLNLGQQSVPLPRAPADIQGGLHALPGWMGLGWHDQECSRDACHPGRPLAHQLGEGWWDQEKQAQVDKYWRGRVAQGEGSLLLEISRSEL